MISLRHKRRDCIGCALCAEVAPHYWRIDADGLAQLRQVAATQPPYQIAHAFPEDLPALRQAARHCPVNLIQIE